ncbi:LysR family transcriptional regulator [Caballeronia sp. GAWG2-1]|uniref:LysR family transcriptional regulator n=1 Tax=Caballeronia sp. GAWG2-1 TaxID=2921744 RepID=UPI00202956F4|nr:LysR family transcriptional regulator [Caballeronia sp. GAWG2-1]
MNGTGLLEAETFLFVAEYGGFGAAARELGVTQSTISRRISLLESRVGVRLIERTTRHVALTDAGKSYASELRDILLRLRHAEAQAQRGAAEPEGLLRITMPTAFGRACVIPCLTRLANRHTRLRFEVDLSDRYADLLEGNFDVAVRLASTSQSGISERHIASADLCLCASSAYVAMHGPITEPAQIVAHECLALQTYAPRTSWNVIWQGTRTEISFTPKMVVSDLFALADFCRAGLGVAVLPMYAIGSALADGSVVDAAPELSFVPLEVFAAYAHGREKLPKVAAFLEALNDIGSVGAPLKKR